MCVGGGLCRPRNLHHPRFEDTVGDSIGSSETTLGVHRVRAQGSKPSKDVFATEARWAGRLVSHCIVVAGTSWFHLGLQQATCLQQQSFSVSSGPSIVITHLSMCTSLYTKQASIKNDFKVCLHLYRGNDSRKTNTKPLTTASWEVRLR